MGKMMKNVLKKLARDEEGQAFILVLIFLLVGGLITAPLLSYMSTGLLAGQMHEEKMEGLYAADAGVEDALWKIKNDLPASYLDPYQLLTDVNGMLVTIDIEEVVLLYGIDVGAGGVHWWWFALESEFLSYDGDESWGTYNYRLSLTNKKGSPVKITSLTVSYSNELSYLSGLTNGDIAGLAPPPMSDFEDGNPSLPETQVGNSKILTWDFPAPRPEMEAAGDLDDPGTWVTVTCTFQLEGPPDIPEITFYLVEAQDSDIGTVWAVKPFSIEAKAYDGSTLVTTVLANVLRSSNAVLIGSWQIE